MATPCTSLARMRAAGLTDLPIDEPITQLCHKHAYRFRDRLLPPLVTIRLMILQILHLNTAITHLRHLASMNFSAAAYCQARLRVPTAVMNELLEWVIQQAQRTADAAWLIGQRVFIVDCSSFSMPDTPELRKHFGLPRGRKMMPDIAYPTAKLLGLMDVATGMFSQLMAMPLFTHDLRASVGVQKLLRSGDILLGDRAFCSYGHLALLHMSGIFGCFRLHQRRKEQGHNGIVTWQRPKAVPKWMCRDQFQALPQTLVVRLLSHRIDRPGFRTAWITIATTLLDEQQWPDQKLLDLYCKRWEIETCFGHLKTSLKMNVLKCKSVAGVLRELAAYLLVYNLVRLAMLRAAERQQVEVGRISFIDAARWLECRMLGLEEVEELIVNPRRRGRVEPRVIRRRMKEYPLMKRPRHVLRAELQNGKEVGAGGLK